MRIDRHILRQAAFFGFCLLGTALRPVADHQVDPTFLRRWAPEIQEKPADVSSNTCHYKPIFGMGDSQTGIVKGVARFGDMLVDPGGASAIVNYPGEEQVYVFLEGSGTLLYADQKVQLRQNDFVYLPPGIKHGVSAPSDKACRIVVMGFKISANITLPISKKPLVANIDEVPRQVVEGHPSSVLYQLLMGDTQSKRDRIAAGQVLTSLFVMEFALGGTNSPHHHETEEEIYLVLEGAGEMVAGGGVTGIEGRYPAKAGDAYFFRLNCTVGFYNSSQPGTNKARILAVRSLFPGCRR